MSDFELTLNDETIVRQAQSAFKEANEKIPGDVVQEIKKPKWSWPRETERVRGNVVVGSPRNIEDTTTLLISYGADATSNEYEHSWNAEHATAVHEGAVLSTGTVLPARPYTKQPLKQFPKNYEKLLDVKLGK